MIPIDEALQHVPLCSCEKCKLARYQPKNDASWSYKGGWYFRVGRRIVDAGEFKRVFSKNGQVMVWQINGPCWTYIGSYSSDFPTYLY